MEKAEVQSPSKTSSRKVELEQDTLGKARNLAKKHEREGNRTKNNESGSNQIVCCENKQAEMLASEILNKARKVERKTTSFMKRLENNGGKLMGLDYRLKSIESLSRKILSDSHAKGVSLEDSAKSIGDSLRYTMIISEEKYTNVVERSLEQLQENGYKVNKIKNYWGNDIYQGINVSLITPDGVKMELQFHTEDSYYTKETLNHKYYEIARSESASMEEIVESTEKMMYNQSLVKIPTNAGKISEKEFFKNGKD